MFHSWRCKCFCGFLLSPTICSRGWGKGWSARMLCSETCGCSNPGGEFINVQGCPYLDGECRNIDAFAEYQRSCSAKPRTRSHQDCLATDISLSRIVAQALCTQPSHQIILRWMVMDNWFTTWLAHPIFWSNEVVFAWKKMRQLWAILLHGEHGSTPSDPMQRRNPIFWADSEKPLPWHRLWRIMAVALSPTWVPRTCRLVVASAGPINLTGSSRPWSTFAH